MPALVSVMWYIFCLRRDIKKLESKQLRVGRHVWRGKWQRFSSWRKTASFAESSVRCEEAVVLEITKDSCHCCCGSIELNNTEARLPGCKWQAAKIKITTESHVWLSYLLSNAMALISDMWDLRGSWVFDKHLRLSKSSRIRGVEIKSQLASAVQMLPCTS